MNLYPLGNSIVETIHHTLGCHLTTWSVFAEVGQFGDFCEGYKSVIG